MVHCMLEDHRSPTLQYRVVSCRSSKAGMEMEWELEIPTGTAKIRVTSSTYMHYLHMFLSMQE